LADELKELGNVGEMPAAEAMRRLATHGEGPVILVEPSDNVGGGAPGDGTGLLRVLLEHNIEKTVVVINDPAAVALLAAAPLGSRAPLSIGGKGSPLDAGPLAIERNSSRAATATSLWRTRTAILLDGRQAHRHGRLCGRALRGSADPANSRKTPPFDLGQLRSQGIVPEQQYVIVVKAAVAHRQAYDPIAAATYWVDTPGPCSSNLRVFPYRKVRRPIDPLD